MRSRDRSQSGSVASANGSASSLSHAQSVALAVNPVHVQPRPYPPHTTTATATTISRAPTLRCERLTAESGLSEPITRSPLDTDKSPPSLLRRHDNDHPPIKGCATIT